jgi:hypothetical protein
LFDEEISIRDLQGDLRKNPFVKQKEPSSPLGQKLDMLQQASFEPGARMETLPSEHSGLSRKLRNLYKRECAKAELTNSETDFSNANFDKLKEGGVDSGTTVKLERIGNHLEIDKKTTEGLARLFRKKTVREKDKTFVTGQAEGGGVVGGRTAESSRPQKSKPSATTQPGRKKSKDKNGAEKVNKKLFLDQCSFREGCRKLFCRIREDHVPSENSVQGAGSLNLPTSLLPKNKVSSQLSKPVPAASKSRSNSRTHNPQQRPPAAASLHLDQLKKYMQKKPLHNPSEDNNLCIPDRTNKHKKKGFADRNPLFVASSVEGPLLEDRLNRVKRSQGINTLAPALEILEETHGGLRPRLKHLAKSVENVRDKAKTKSAM